MTGVQRIVLAGILIGLGAISCSSGSVTLPSQQPDAAAATPSPPDDVEAQSTQQPAPPAEESSGQSIEAFQRALADALELENYDDMRALMGNVFFLNYYQREGAPVASEDAITVLQQDLIAGGSVPIITQPEVNVVEQIDQSINQDEATTLVFSTGWGPDDSGEAILYITRRTDGSLFWSGLLFAAEGFPATNSTEEDAADEPVTSDDGEAVVTEVEANPAEVGSLLYETSFGSGWPEIDTGTGESAPVSGGYQIQTTQALWTFTTRATASSYYAEVTATAATCPEQDGAYGILFHYVSDEDFRAFVIRCDGEWRLFQKNSPRLASAIASGTLPSNIDPLAEDIRVGVLSQNNVLTLYVDDIPVGTVNVESTPEGDVGPYVQTDADSITVVFSRLAVFEPG